MSADSPGSRVAEPYAYIAIGAISLSMLTYQILLTRVSALRLFFHFSFLVISNCLLGIGAAGTMITVYQDRWRENARFWIWLFSSLYLVSLFLSYAFVLTFEITPSFNFVRFEDFVRFSAFNLASAVPFFFAGTVVGLILTFNARDVNRVYFTDLTAAGAGCLVTPFLLGAFGAGGCLIFVVLAGLVAAVASAPARRSLALGVGGALSLGLLFLMPHAEAAFPVPGKGDLRFTGNITANVTDITEFSRWSTNSRIDVVPVTPDARQILTLGNKGDKSEIPDQRFIVQDGSAGTYIINWSENPDKLHLLDTSMYTAALSLKEEPRVFIIGVGGGNDVWAAMHSGASYVKGIELNRPILDIHHEVYPHFSKDMLEDPRVELVNGEGRSALMRDDQLYDVIQMTGIDTWTALASGAYLLAENYLYTREALQDMASHLVDGGILQIVRIAADMEALRLLSNIDSALSGEGWFDLSRSVACLKTDDYFFAVLVKKGHFTPEESTALAAFADRAGVEAVYLPGTAPDLQQHRWAQFIVTPDKESYIRAFPRDISPTTDDRPYFFSYTKWSNLLGSVEHIYEPTFLSQGNPFFIFAQLLLSTVLAAGLIVLPLVLSRHRQVERTHLRRFLVYFIGLGMGFIAIEVALIQKLTLFLGHPLYSITVTLFCILIFTGLGSLLSARWFERSGEHTWGVPLGIAGTLGFFITISPFMVDLLIGASLTVRVIATMLVLAPVGFLLGVPLAYGIRLLDRLNPTLIPWAWAVNACFTVVGSIFTVILSMNLGFNAVLFSAAIIYAVAFWALPADRATAPA